MAMCKCPSCERRRSIGAGSEDEFFELLGGWPGSRWPVYRCLNCGADLIVRPRFLTFGARAELITPEMWREASGQVSAVRAAVGNADLDAVDFDQVLAATKLERTARRRGERDAHGKSVPCPRCRSFFHTESALAQHMSSKHAKEAADGR